jgi:hypothetical protein
MKRLRIENARSSDRVSNPKSAIPNSKSLLVGVVLLGASMGLSAAPKAHSPSPTPTPTPTPRHRLTGGFGKPAATPVVSETGGQDLSDLVHAASEAKARKEQKPSVSITNETLVTDSRKGKLTTSPPRTLPTPTLASTPSVAAASPSATEGGEAEWRERARSARRRVEDLKARASQIEADAAALEKDFYRWDDGQYRDGVIKPAWDKKKEELQAVRNELVEAEKDLADLPEKARKAGALPGWLRE